MDIWDLANTHWQTHLNVKRSLINTSNAEQDVQTTTNQSTEPFILNESLSHNTNRALFSQLDLCFSMKHYLWRRTWQAIFYDLVHVDEPSWFSWACGYPDWALWGAKVWMSRSKGKHRLPALILRSPVCAVCLCVRSGTLLKKCCSGCSGPLLKYTAVWRSLVADAPGQSTLHSHKFPPSLEPALLNTC